MSVPLKRLAPLDQIRGFVAVGRRMSIKEAASDLCLSQSAVSRQVTTLEDALGKTLLVRRHRAISLTPEGERLFRVADSAVQQLQDVFGSLGAAREDMPVTITASIGVTAVWLLPRLVRFQQLYPTVDVRFSASNKVLDMRTESIDLAIRYCAEADAPEGAVKLFGESVVPVAHPSVASGIANNLELMSAKQVLIDLDDHPHHPWLQWQGFSKAAGLPKPNAKAVLRFNQYDQVIQAARAGQGVALGRLPLVSEMIQDGSLRQVGEPIQLTPEYGYWLAQAEDNPRKSVKILSDWIFREAAASL